MIAGARAERTIRGAPNAKSTKYPNRQDLTKWAPRDAGMGEDRRASASRKTFRTLVDRKRSVSRVADGRGALRLTGRHDRWRNAYRTSRVEEAGRSRGRARVERRGTRSEIGVNAGTLRQSNTRSTARKYAAPTRRRYAPAVLALSAALDCARRGKTPALRPFSALLLSRPLAAPSLGSARSHPSRLASRREAAKDPRRSRGG